MPFNSYSFIFIFLPLTLGVFYILQRRRKTRLMTGWLIAASLFFYGWWNPACLLLIGLSVGVNFITGAHLARRFNENRPIRPVLGAGIIFNLLLLGWFKYAGFLAGLAGTGLPHIVLPLAVSFFTFQQIAYLVDVSRGEAQEEGFLRYCLFVTFFPQLIAGPIVRYRETMPQFADKTLFGINAGNLAAGSTFFFLGLFKKTVIADAMAAYADPVFNAADSGGTVYFADAWIAALAYSMQIYFDFSAYSDMAIGLARMVGIQLPLNFFSPYKATSVIDFWRRWHITLSRFLRDYLYIPLGGNRRGKPRRYANLMTTMLLGGLWHGAGWNFLIWGGLHGFYLVVNHAWRSLCASFAVAPGHGRSGRFVAGSVTFTAVTIAWVFFRAATFDGAVTMFKAMAGINGISLPQTVPQSLQPIITTLSESGFFLPLIGAFPLLNKSAIDIALGLLPVMLIAFAAPNTIQFMRHTLRFPADRHFHRLNRHSGTALIWRETVFYACVTAVIAVSGLLAITTTSAFLYFRF